MRNRITGSYAFSPLVMLWKMNQIRDTWSPTVKYSPVFWRVYRGDWNTEASLSNFCSCCLCIGGGASAWLPLFTLFLPGKHLLHQHCKMCKLSQHSGNWLTTYSTDITPQNRGSTFLETQLHVTVCHRSYKTHHENNYFNCYLQLIIAGLFSTQGWSWNALVLFTPSWPTPQWPTL